MSNNNAKKLPTVKKKDLKEVALLPSDQVKKLGKVPPLTKFQGYKVNPFTHNWAREGLPIRNKSVSDDAEHIVTDVRTGEVQGIKTTGIKTVKDTAQFVKFFAGFWHVHLGLKPAAARLLMILMAYLQTKKVGTEQLQINYHYLEAMMDDLQAIFPENAENLKMMSLNAYYASMRSLIANDIIAPVHLSSESYWVNTAMLFNGDRIAIFNAIEIDRSDDAIRLANAGITREVDLRAPQGELSDVLQDASPYTVQDKE